MEGNYIRSCFRHVSFLLTMHLHRSRSVSHDLLDGKKLQIEISERCGKKPVNNHTADRSLTDRHNFFVGGRLTPRYQAGAFGTRFA